MSNSPKKERKTNKTYRMSDGSRIVENIVIDKEQDKVISHKIDKRATSQKSSSSNMVEVTDENALKLNAKLLDDLNKRTNFSNKTLHKILKQLVEMNYYLVTLVQDEFKDDDAIKKHFKDLGLDGE